MHSSLSSVMTTHTVVLMWKRITHFSQIIITDYFISQTQPEHLHVSIETAQDFKGLLQNSTVVWVSKVIQIFWVKSVS